MKMAKSTWRLGAVALLAVALGAPVGDAFSADDPPAIIHFYGAL
jgi:hypothetical protein